MKKKVLIIAYYWPPAGGPGVQRWLKFVKYLPEFDIEPTVFIPENPSYPILDISLRDEVPKEATIVRLKIKEPYRFAKFLSTRHVTSIASGVIPKEKRQTLIQKILLYVRGNYFIPDARKAWVSPSIKFLTTYIQDHHIETVITTGPPHSLHLIGLGLKQRLNITWFADFRDPWTTIGYHKKLKLTKEADRKHQILEKTVLQNADRIIVTSENTKKEFQNKTQQPIDVITNGFDTHHLPKSVPDDKFTIAHIGSLLSGRNPKNLWRSLQELINENIDFKSHFQLKLVGVVSDDVLNDIYSYGLEDYVNIVGYLNHNDALMQQRNARILLMIEIDSEDTKSIIPGKLFEYMISKTPILGIGPEGTDVERIIATTNTGSYLYYDDKDLIKSQILTYFQGYIDDSLTTDPIGLEKYSRKELTRTLSKLIKSN